MAPRTRKQQRVIRTVVTLLLIGGALVLAPIAPVAAIMAGLFAVAAAVMTVTGWRSAPTGQATTDAPAGDGSTTDNAPTPHGRN